MTTNLPIRRPKQFWNSYDIRPGAVSSVGDVNLQVRLKHSYPDQYLRYDPIFSGKKLCRIGANVTDGQHQNYDTGAGPAKLIDTNWGGRRDFKTQIGWEWQDFRPIDKTIETELQSTPQFTWRTKTAQVYNAMRTGSKFLPLPGGYDIAPGEIPRGGNYPRITDIAGGDPSFVGPDNTGVVRSTVDNPGPQPRITGRMAQRRER